MKTLNNISLLEKNIEKPLIGFLAFSTALFLFFQIKVSYEHIYFNINLADALGLSGLVLGSLRFFLEKRKIPYSIPYTNLFWLASIIAFSLALFVGWIRFGSNTWAFYTKFLGWFVIIGYAMLGSLFAESFKEKGLMKMAEVLTTTVITILSVKFLFFYLIKYKIYYYPVGNLYDYFSGFAPRNTFSFQLLIVMCLQFAYLSLNPKKTVSSIGYIAFICLGIYFTYARAALGIMCFLFLLFYFLKFINLKTIFYIIGLLLLLINSGTIIDFMSGLLTSFLGVNSLNISISQTYYSYPSANQERIFSMIEGLKIWLNSPIFGGGLGSFVESMKVTKETFLTHKNFLVIHSSYIFLLAEFGLIGFSVFLMYGVQILKYLYSRIILQYKTNSLSLQGRILIGIVPVFLIMGTAHDMLFQRIFWFVFGMCIVKLSQAPSQKLD
ncbi:MAG: O-antigen ligase family protein [Alphaproteobacteria bacterium]